MSTQYIPCKCGNEATHRQVKKEGSNQGKWFYACPLPKEQGCGFFQWDVTLPPMVKPGKVTRATLGLKKRKHSDTTEEHPDCEEEDEEITSEKRSKENTVNINLLANHVLKMESEITEQLKKLNTLFLTYMSK